MNLQNAHKEVKEWMAAFGQETPEKSTKPKEDTIHLRTYLINEEVGEELLPALDELSILHDDEIYLKMLDSCGDSLFVIIGTLVAFGVNTQEVWNEIVKSNWTKFWTKTEVRRYLGDHPDSSLQFKATFQSDNSEARNYIALNENGKVIKSPSFTPPDLIRFLPKEPSSL